MASLTAPHGHFHSQQHPNKRKNRGTASFQRCPKHSLEARVVRQRYNVQAGAIEHEQVKFRATVLRKSTEKGTIETGNPYGSTEKFSVLRYEEIVDGETVPPLPSPQSPLSAPPARRCRTSWISAPSVPAPGACVLCCFRRSAGPPPSGRRLSPGRSGSPGPRWGLPPSPLSAVPARGTTPDKPSAP